jgi:hypothetical protein
VKHQRFVPWHWLAAVLNVGHNLTHSHETWKSPDGATKFRLCYGRWPGATVDFYLWRDGQWVPSTKEWVFKVVGIPDDDGEEQP